MSRTRSRLLSGTIACAAALGAFLLPATASADTRGCTTQEKPGNVGAAICTEGWFRVIVQCEQNSGVVYSAVGPWRQPHEGTSEATCAEGSFIVSISVDFP